LKGENSSGLSPFNKKKKSSWLSPCNKKIENNYGLSPFNKLGTNIVHIALQIDRLSLSKLLRQFILWCLWLVNSNFTTMMSMHNTILMIEVINLRKLNYSETCLNQTLNKPESCINWTLNKVLIQEIFVIFLNVACRSARLKHVYTIDNVYS
jgi:hypothetical protein